MLLGEKLKKARKNIGMSQNEVAEELILSRQTISKWENNHAVACLIRYLDCVRSVHFPCYRTLNKVTVYPVLYLFSLYLSVFRYCPCSFDYHVSDLSFYQSNCDYYIK